MPDVDLNALAASLADTARDMDVHIERRARQITDPQITAIQAAAKGQLDRQARDHGFEQQRKDDLIAELRRQLDAQIKQVDRLGREVKETRGAIRRLEALHIWSNEERQQFYFADDVHAALAETGSPAARALAEIRHRQAATGGAP